MEKYIVTLLILFFSFPRINAMQNIIVARGNNIILCDVDSNTEKHIATIDNLDLWHLANCTYEDSRFVLILIRRYGYWSFVGSPEYNRHSTANQIIKEMIITFDNESPTKIETDSIKYENGSYFRYKNDQEREELSYDYIRKLYDANKSISIINHGDVEYIDALGNNNTILKREHRSYYMLVRTTNNGNKILCQKAITKYSDKNIVRRTIVEYDLKKKEFTNLQLEGSFPSYSEDAKYVLYSPTLHKFKKHDMRQAIFSLDEKKEVFICYGQQAIWVKNYKNVLL